MRLHSHKYRWDFELNSDAGNAKIIEQEPGSFCLLYSTVDRIMKVCISPPRTGSPPTMPYALRFHIGDDQKLHEWDNEKGEHEISSGIGSANWGNWEELLHDMEYFNSKSVCLNTELPYCRVGVAWRSTSYKNPGVYGAAPEPAKATTGLKPRTARIVLQLGLPLKSSLDYAMAHATGRYGMAFTGAMTLKEKCSALEKEFCNEDAPHDPGRLDRVIDELGDGTNLPEALEVFFELCPGEELPAGCDTVRLYKQSCDGWKINSVSFSLAYGRAHSCPRRSSTYVHCRR